MEIPSKQVNKWLYEKQLIPYDWVKLLDAAETKFD